MRRSSHTVTYRDLVAFAEQGERDTAQRLAGARSRGVMNLEALTHRHEIAKTLVRMLKKGLPGKQTDFAALFEQVVK